MRRLLPAYAAAALMAVAPVGEAAAATLYTADIEGGFAIRDAKFRAVDQNMDRFLEFSELRFFSGVFGVDDFGPSAFSFRVTSPDSFRVPISDVFLQGGPQSLGPGQISVSGFALVFCNCPSITEERFFSLSLTGSTIQGSALAIVPTPGALSLSLSALAGLGLFGAFKSRSRRRSAADPARADVA